MCCVPVPFHHIPSGPVGSPGWECYFSDSSSVGFKGLGGGGRHQGKKLRQSPQSTLSVPSVNSLVGCSHLPITFPHLHPSTQTNKITCTRSLRNCCSPLGCSCYVDQLVNGCACLAQRQAGVGVTTGRSVLGCCSAAVTGASLVHVTSFSSPKSFSLKSRA